MITDRYIVNVEGAVVKDGQYLMVVRGEQEYAPGGLNFPGGKVEGVTNLDDVLEETLRREIAEEVGLEIHDEMAYVRSSAFVAEGDPVVDVVFLCRYKAGLHGFVDHIQALSGQADADTAPIVRVRIAPDQALTLEMIDASRHGARSQE